MNQLIAQLKEVDQDFEFYPTTDEIIGKLIADLRGIKAATDGGHYGDQQIRSFLDIGAGNGKVIRAVKEATSLLSD